MSYTRAIEDARTAMHIFKNKFEARLAVRTSWGRNELKLALAETMEDALVYLISQWESKEYSEEKP